MQFARINGVVLHFAWRPPAAGAPVIAFVNSLGSDFRIWDKVVAALPAEFGVLRYDKRGHGLSDIGATPYAMADHVGDLAGLLDHLAIAGAIISGLSVGGMIAQGLSAARPDLVRALVLNDTAHRIGTEDLWNTRIKAVTEQGIAAIAGDILARWFTPAFRAETNPDFVGCRNMLVRSPVAGYAGTCAALRDTDYTEVARAIAVPTLCVVGDQDGSTPPALVRELADLVPGARYEVIADAAHLPCIEQPARLAGLIAGFAAEPGQGR